ncbi:MAG: type I secretion system permease/ATPase [Deferribacterales bacterium]
MNRDIAIDPLMQCLVTLTMLNNKPASAEALAYGLPLDPDQKRQSLFTIEGAKSNFSRAASRAGFNSKLVKRELKDIPNVILPVILLLKSQNACVLTDIDFEAGIAEIIIPSIDEEPQEITIEKLSEEYMGFCFLLKRVFKQDEHDAIVDEKQDNKHWFFGTLWRFRDIYINVFIASFLINLFVTVSPLFTMNVYDRVIPHNAVDTLWVLAIGVCIIYMFDIIIKYLRSYFLEVAAKKSDVILSSMIFEQALNLRMKEKPKSVGSFASNIKEFDSIRSFYASTAVTAFIELPFVAIFLIVIYYISGLLVLIPIFTMVFIICYSLFVRKPLQRSIESSYESSARRNGLLIEALSNLEAIKTFNASSYIQWNWEESTGDISNKSIKSRMLSNSLTSASAFLAQIGNVAVVVAGVYFIKEGELTMGALIATVMLSSRTIAPMSQVAGLLTNYQQMRTSLTQLNALMEKDVERPEKKGFLRRPIFEGGIEFNDVTFSYPDEPQPALKNITFKIKPKERVGIIGAVGSGKSTLSKLILGLYDPDEGSIFIDGIACKQIDPADLRHNIGYVPQDVTLFSGTIRDNIIFKAPHSDDNAIIKAAQVGNVISFSDKHALGLDFFVGEKGANLSGGQRQSVAVSRAMLTDSSIVLMDEPTNSMDFASENKVIENLRKATEGKTTIIITHKPSILTIVDRLIVMDNGTVVMDGPKDEVLKKLGGKQ